MPIRINLQGKLITHLFHVFQEVTFRNHTTNEGYKLRCLLNIHGRLMSC